ncbi:hypothetical protein [Candidatus Magnetaquicoccus inordinatus]|uniref:hypothetical protein n=1 Tax=Candidatus Magnetaquicoccus inordinatus TaxID=2496818 RepID=UPI00102C857F|nr:hypothetical protein [Candidatus Magnetaquicoccus inordinatus]
MIHTLCLISYQQNGAVADKTGTPHRYGKRDGINILLGNQYIINFKELFSPHLSNWHKLCGMIGKQQPPPNHPQGGESGKQSETKAES